jgi:hypothetical protein
VAESIDASGNISSKAVQSLSVTVPGVTDATKITDLNVGQLAAILQQVFAQSIVAKAPDAATISAAFDKVGAIIAAQQQDAGIEGVIQRAQQSILTKAPSLQQTTGAKDGGQIVLPVRPAPVK